MNNEKMKCGKKSSKFMRFKFSEHKSRNEPSTGDIKRLPIRIPNARECDFEFFCIFTVLPLFEVFCLVAVEASFIVKWSNVSSADTCQKVLLIGGRGVSAFYFECWNDIDIQVVNFARLRINA